MNSDGKVVNMKVLWFFETNNFVVYKILIGGRLRPQKGPAMCRYVCNRTVMKSSG
jgi:hypothetical protein